MYSMTSRILHAISSKNQEDSDRKTSVKAYRMYAIKEIARAFYKDNEDRRFTDSPPNKEGFFTGRYQSDYFRRLLYDQK